VEKLVKNGVINALVAFGKSDSENSNELLSRYLKVIALVQVTLQNKGILRSKLHNYFQIIWEENYLISHLLM